MDEEMVGMIFNYVRATWYESKCKDKDEIKRIIREELKKSPNYISRHGCYIEINMVRT